jgi:membrane fusion protein (multidrug efflux system)
MTRTNALLPCLLALAAGGLAACGGEEAAVEAPATAVLITPVEVRDLEERIEASGELLAKNRADVAAQVAGEITEILVEEGDAVAEGDALLEIDPERRHLELDRARANVAVAEAAVAEQRREVKRVRALAKKDVASDTQLDQQETALRTARARLEGAKAELGVAERALRDATVRARFAGLIARRHVSRGEFVTTGQPLFELVSLDPIEIEFDLPEADASRVRVGQPIEVTVAPYPDDVFDATVTIIAPTIDRRTRTLRVRALLENHDGRLRPGFFARADLGVAKREQVVMVPEEAVLQRSDGAVVFRVIGNNRVNRRVVQTGIIRGGFVEITSGLGRDDRVVQRGHADLVDGAVVSPRNADGTPAAQTGAPNVAAPPGEVAAQ